MPCSADRPSGAHIRVVGQQARGEARAGAAQALRNPTVMTVIEKTVPYFAQWESRDLTLAVLAEGAAALARDPRWASSGAHSVGEYAAWANSLCGMACLKMVLAARTGRIVPTLELARACTTYGGYTVDPATGAKKGLIYAPFVRFVGKEFGIRAEVVTRASARDLPEIMDRAEFFMASVHHAIRWPDRKPPSKGGHLVLVTAASKGRVVFHNPSGHDVSSQENASLTLEDFDRFFAGRGVAIQR